MNLSIHCQRLAEDQSIVCTTHEDCTKLRKKLVSYLSKFWVSLVVRHFGHRCMRVHHYFHLRSIELFFFSRYFLRELPSFEIQHPVGLPTKKTTDPHGLPTKVHIVRRSHRFCDFPRWSAEEYVLSFTTWPKR